MSPSQPGRVRDHDAYPAGRIGGAIANSERRIAPDQPFARACAEGHSARAGAIAIARFGTILAPLFLLHPTISKERGASWRIPSCGLTFTALNRFLMPTVTPPGYSRCGFGLAPILRRSTGRSARSVLFSSSA